jgi:fructose 1,6-bisphosphatase
MERITVSANPHYVAGGTRGSHPMSLMPVKLNFPARINYAIPIVSSYMQYAQGHINGSP